MKDINTIVSSMDLSKNNKQSFYKEEPITEEEAIVINYIFTRLAGIIPAFKHATDSVVQSTSLRREYTFALKYAGIPSIERINKALRKIVMANVVFVPSPGQFIEFCKINHEDIGAPTPFAAYQEACINSHPCKEDKKWSHKAVKYAANATGSYFLMSSESESKKQSVFNENYLIACQLYADGKIMEQIEGTGQNKELEELKKQESLILPQFKQLTSRETAMAAMKQALRG